MGARLTPWKRGVRMADGAGTRTFEAVRRRP
ncbi:hypothetical protein SAMN05216481_12032 [Streptomyces radiopugnans]|uniref:Uncharacterized protein n=1 Tax=Streptomyces radiopugnans TaxID=403935 RepID=A0A1H9K073_9ACTN|nr:hypothetical protein SAMN05216481_12032 [Streptomyces radiopugnans]